MGEGGAGDGAEDEVAAGLSDVSMMITPIEQFRDNGEMSYASLARLRPDGWLLARMALYDNLANTRTRYPAVPS